MKEQGIKGELSNTSENNLRGIRVNVSWLLGLIRSPSRLFSAMSTSFLKKRKNPYLFTSILFYGDHTRSTSPTYK